jgi:hypothetical protein
MGEHICKTNTALFCPSGNGPSINAVCDNYDKLSDTIKKETSMHTLCKSADLKRMCTDEKLKPLVCPTGTDIGISLC